MPSCHLNILPQFLFALGAAAVFSCPKLPPRNKTTTTVRRLHPQDVSVVLALGDSITAGFGMLGTQSSLLKDLLEYRGLSWSIGGDPDAVTLPNFLRHYNPKVGGANSIAETWITTMRRLGSKLDLDRNLSYSFAERYNLMSFKWDEIVVLPKGSANIKRIRQMKK